MKLQSSLITNNSNNQQEIKSVINSMRPEIANTFGKALEHEVSQLLQNLSGMTDIIEANFTQIKDILEKHKDDVIKAITQEKNKEIAELKNEIKAKEIQINNLILKEG